MPTMFDSVSPGEIPIDAVVVAGYIDGRYKWENGDWARFPVTTEKVRIATTSTTDDGRVLDVETGDATPAEAPGWVSRRRASTEHPLSGPATIYCNLSTWPAVQEAFTTAGVEAPEYWIAHYDNVAEVPAGAVAKQYHTQNSPDYDISITEYGWPVATSVPVVAPAPVQVEPSPLPPAEGTPTAQQLDDAELVELTDIADAEKAIADGWHLWYFSEHHNPPFVHQVNGQPTGCALYASKAWASKA